jgi:acylphosphatase
MQRRPTEGEEAGSGSGGEHRAAPSKRAFHALVEGRVQGVGFRYTARHEALRRNLKGWVRNLPDGSVELWAEGERRALEEYRAWLEEGPPGAWVASVKAEPRPYSGSFSDFEIDLY